jgi:hypothetical protein
MTLDMKMAMTVKYQLKDRNAQDRTSANTGNLLKIRHPMLVVPNHLPSERGSMIARRDRSS